MTGDTACEARGLPGLAFLEGAWRGEGTWDGSPFTAEAEWTRLPGDHLFGRIRSVAAGRERREHVVVHAVGDGAEALVLPERGGAQRFEVQELEALARYRFVFTPPAAGDLVPQRWIVERTETGYRERFEIARDGRFEESVTCVYTADGGTA